MKIRDMIYLLLLVVSFGVGFMINQPKEEFAVVPTPAKEYQVSTQQKMLIHTYLDELSKGKDVSSLLTGEAKENFRTQNQKPMTFEYQLEDIWSILNMDSLAVVGVRIGYQDDQGHDQIEEQFFTLYTPKDDSWKISQVSRMYPIWTTPDVNDSKGRRSISGPVIESYLTAISKSEWKQALQMTGGELKRQGEKTVSFLPKQLNVKIDQITYEKVAEGKKREVLMVKYHVNNGLTSPQTFTKLMVTNHVKNKWLITHEILLDVSSKNG